MKEYSQKEFEFQSRILAEIIDKLRSLDLDTRKRLLTCAFEFLVAGQEKAK